MPITAFSSNYDSIPHRLHTILVTSLNITNVRIKRSKVKVVLTGIIIVQRACSSCYDDGNIHWEMLTRTVISTSVLTI